jgi:hypothetical protein
MAFPEGLNPYAKQRFGASMAEVRANEHGLEVEVVELPRRRWLRLNGHLAAVFAHGVDENEPWTWRREYPKSLADAEFIVFVDCSDTEPRCRVLPVDRYRKLTSGAIWDATQWLERWDLIPA